MRGKSAEKKCGDFHLLSLQRYSVPLPSPYVSQDDANDIQAQTPLQTAFTTSPPLAHRYTITGKLRRYSPNHQQPPVEGHIAHWGTPTGQHEIAEDFTYYPKHRYA